MDVGGEWGGVHILDFIGGTPLLGETPDVHKYPAWPVRNLF